MRPHTRAQFDLSTDILFQGNYIVVEAVDDLWHWLMDKLMDGWRNTWLINQYLITHNTHNYISSENDAWWEQQNRTETEV